MEKIINNYGKIKNQYLSALSFITASFLKEADETIEQVISSFDEAVKENIKLREEMNILKTTLENEKKLNEDHQLIISEQTRRIAEFEAFLEVANNINSIEDDVKKQE